MPLTPRARLRSVLAVVATAAGGLVVATAVAPPAQAAGGFAAGDLVVYRVGDGTTTLSGTSVPVFLDEFSTAGAKAQSIAYPTANSGSTKAYSDSGSASSDGQIALSPNGKYLTSYGYNAAPGTPGITSTTAVAAPRVVALVRSDGTIDTSTALTDAQSGNNARTAIPDDTGTHAWVAGGTSGVRYAAIGATSSTQVSDTTSTTNLRSLQIGGGQLYAGTASGSAFRIAAVGTGLPTSSPAPFTNLTFSTTPTGPEAYQFVTLGGSTPNVLYVADADAGQVRKYSLVGSTWTLNGSVAVSGVLGLTTAVSAGVVTVYVTNATTLAKLTDASGAGGTLSGAPTTLATAAANTAFRGVAFAPVGSTSTPPANPPTLTVAKPAIGTTLGDADTNPSSTPVTLGVGTNGTYAAGDITLTAGSNNTAVLPNANITVTGSGATRTVTLSPGGTPGAATVTLTATAPDAQTATATIAYGVSANLGDASDRYLYGASNASAAQDAGDGYVLVGDDEDNAIKLYDTAHSGGPVKNFDFSASLPFGTKEVDTEAAARIGDTIYWLGSMSNNSSGNIAPARSTLFATTVSGSGASTTLTWAGASTTLQSDLVNWDHDNGHGLGADYFGFNASVNGGVANHQIDSFNVEGLEIAPDGSTGWISFRAPISPASNRTKALIVPVTNFSALVGSDPTAVHATFGAPIQLDLGGLGIRDIRRTASGQYLILAGTADSTNAPFTLYTWDGVAGDAPLQGQDLPVAPGGGAGTGSWEGIGALPGTLTAGAGIPLLQDDGDVTWYLDGQTSKNGQPAAQQKSLLRTVPYVTPTAAATTTTLSASDSSVTAGDPVTYTATVSGGSGPLTGGTMSFTTGDGVISGCASVAVAGDGTAACTTSFARPGSYQVTASYSGTATSATSTSAPVTTSVAPVIVATTTTLAASDAQPAIGELVTYTATVAAAGGSPTGTVAFTEGGTALTGCANVAVGNDGTATCSLTYPHAGAHQVVAAYSGAATFGASTSDPVTVTVQPTAVVVTADDQSVVFGQADPAFTYTTSPAVTLPTPPTCSVAGPHTAVGTYPITCTGADGGSDFTVSYASGTLTVLKAATDVALTSDPAAPVAGQSFDLVATVTTSGPGGVVPTGTVAFSADGADVPTCAAVALGADGVARCTVTGGRGAGSHPATATYSGDGSFSSAAGDANVVVARAATTTTVASDNDAVVTGQAVTFTATVAVTAPGLGSPTGTVAFLLADGITLSGCGAVAVDSDGTAQCVVGGGFTPQGLAVHAVYSGDADFGGSSSDPVAVTVSKASTQVDVTASANAPVNGQVTTYTATVSPLAPGAGTPTGTAVFTIAATRGTQVVACTGGNTVTLDHGRATCVVPVGKLAGGQSYTVAVSYAGDAAFASSDGSLAQTISRASTTVTLTTSPTQPVTGSTLTARAVVSTVAPGGGRPGGTVTFAVTSASGKHLACADGNTVDAGSGVPTCVVASGVIAASDGPYAVLATYSGSARHTASNATAIATVAKSASTSVAVQSSATSAQGRPVTFGIVVTPSRPGPSPLGGTVTFVVRGANGTTVACGGGGALTVDRTQSCTVPGASMVAANGPYTVTATWSGDPDVNGSRATLKHAVVPR